MGIKNNIIALAFLDFLKKGKNERELERRIERVINFLRKQGKIKNIIKILDSLEKAYRNKTLILEIIVSDSHLQEIAEKKIKDLGAFDEYLISENKKIGKGIIFYTTRGERLEKSLGKYLSDIFWKVEEEMKK